MDEMNQNLENSMNNNINPAVDSAQEALYQQDSEMPEEAMLEKIPEGTQQEQGTGTEVTPTAEHQVEILSAAERRAAEKAEKAAAKAAKKAVNSLEDKGPVYVSEGTGKRKRRSSVTFGKILEFVLMLLCSVGVVASIVIAILLFNFGFYTDNPNQIARNLTQDVVDYDVRKVVHMVEMGQIEEAKFYCNNRNIACFQLVESDEAFEPLLNGDVFLFENTGFPEDSYGNVYSIRYTTSSTVDNHLSWHHYVGNVIILDYPSLADEYRLTYFLVRYGFALRYWIYGIGLFFGLLWILLFANLLVNAGYRRGAVECIPTAETYIPFDLQMIATAGIAGLICSFIAEFGGDGSFMDIFVLALGVLALEALVVLWLMSLVIRIRTKHIWNGSFVGWVWSLICRLCKLIYRGIATVLSGISYLWKTVLAVVLYGIVAGLLAMWACYDREQACLLLWFIVTAAACAFLIYCAYMYYRLKQATKTLASGTLEVDIDTKYMIPEFKDQAEDLKRISGGISASVDDRLTSERMKTQLITNVSHDLKTPLTSVINYTDLISKEPTDNLNIKEYTEVLNRQAVRLKHLLEDLVEASKVSSGAVEVNLENCQPDVILSQTAAEYEDRLAASNLQLVLKLSGQERQIKADPRHLWRVFENLLNNICKYAQPGTRVYISDEFVNGKCYFVFKNTSAMELDIAPGELMERFVRGDSSRGTEGNGLGLSIAQSLVSLQNGEMHLDIDGDLFKVVLIFDAEN